VFNLKSMLSCPYGYYDYVWIDCALIRKTRKAILIEFDDRKAWLPKAWIVRAQCSRTSKNPVAISIRISLYNWAKKSQ